MSIKSRELTLNYKNNFALWSNLIKENPKAWAAYNNLGAIYMANGATEEALGLFNKSVEINPNNALTYYNIGSIYYALDRQEDARKAYEKAVRVESGDRKAFNRFTLPYLVDADAIDDAIGFWEGVAQVEPDSARAHYNLAFFYFQQKNYELTIEHCDKLIALGYEVDHKFMRLLQPYRK